MESPKTRSKERLYFTRGDSAFLDGIADAMPLDRIAEVSRPKVVVTIPAHNEEQLIAKCLESLAGQRTVFGGKVDESDFEILVLCHKCTDNTLAVCRDFKRHHKHLNLIVLETNGPAVNNVGAVRRILMRIARSRISSSQGYIAMTDADTVVHPYWMANLLGYMASGYGLVCGRIHIDLEGVDEQAKRTLVCKRRYDELRMLLESRFVRYESDPAPRHSDNSGPNMAVRADVYDRVGGMPPIGFCEDVAFYDAVIRGGYKVRHCPLTIVTTSGRIDPRAPWGFGAELSGWGGSEENVCEVEGLDALLERFRIYQLLHDYLNAPKGFGLSEIAYLSGIELPDIQSYVDELGSARAILHALEKRLDTLDSWRRRYPKVGVFQACPALETYLSRDGLNFSQTCRR